MARDRRHDAPAQLPGEGPQFPPVTPTPEPPRRSFFARHRILTAVLVVVGVGVAASVAGGGDEAGTTAAARPTATVDGAEPVTPPEPGVDDADDQPEPAEGAPGVGDPVRDGSFEFTVVEVADGGDRIGTADFGVRAQGAFLLVTVKVENVGDAPQYFFGDNQTLVDGEGREHSADSEAAIYLEDSASLAEEVNPGNTVTGTVVFDLPASAEPASLRLHDSAFSGGVVVQLG
ncbi:hypothetical protein GCM10011331_03220 [Flavimobilis marinus]|uniref:DUF4352 domain-containing protein n=1 Tax=Flavimobilis marinus TaxID=285351 RepID=A0A1I2DR39_9MICO|nr:DUF4352 domain-containing protein [Flavimobilis marinus]GHG44567.1 hypothetical protein GCM10011331_03220 [Flavimobilis marinus]SFE82909.1 protein of unknown function [Flavimobilis marinus]